MTNHFHSLNKGLIYAILGHVFQNVKDFFGGPKRALFEVLVYVSISSNIFDSFLGTPISPRKYSNTSIFPECILENVINTHTEKHMLVYI